METEEKVKHEIEYLERLKIDFSKLNVYLIERIINEISKSRIETTHSVAGLKVITASTNIVQKRNDLLDELSLMIINRKLENIAIEAEENTKREKYDFDIQIFTKIFEYCKAGKGVIFDNTFSEFMKAVETADFSILKPTARNKGKIKNLVHFINSRCYMNSNWYSDVVKSLGIKKSDCVSNSQKWYGGLEGYIKENKAT